MRSPRPARRPCASGTALRHPQLIARDASDVTLRVNARGEALVGYTAKGKRWNVLAWGALNARHPTEPPQVAFQLDYSGGWRTYRRARAAASRTSAGRTPGPPLAWFVTGCTMPDGSHWALQAWQRGLPNLGLDALDAAAGVVGAPAEPLDGELPKLELWTNWAYSKRFHHVFGRLTYAGQPVYGLGSTAKGSPTDALWAQHLPRHAQLGVRRRAGSARTASSPIAAPESFCYGFYPHDPYPGYPATGTRPGGQGRALPRHGRRPRRPPRRDVGGRRTDRLRRGPRPEVLDVQREVYGAGTRCKPL